MSYASLSRDTGIQVKTIRNYVEIAKDTLIAFEVPAFRKTVTRKAVASSKLFLFDVGVVGALAQRGQVQEGSELFGFAFEHFIALELRAYLSYRRTRLELTHWRSLSQMEVDFVVGERLAIEVKTTTHVTSADLKGLRALRDEGLVKEFAVVSRDPVKRNIDGITIWPWREFLSELWRGRDASMATLFA